MVDMLRTGMSALQAFQRSLSTVSHNIANVATPGYTRQTAVLANRPGIPSGNGIIGAGVDAVAVQRTLNTWLQRDLDASTSEKSYATRMAQWTTDVDGLFSSAGTSLTGPLNDFLAAGQALSSNPTDPAAREAWLQRLGTLVQRTDAVGARLADQRQSLGQEVDQRISDTNQLLARFSALNQTIVQQTGLASGQPPNDLLDERDRLVQQIGEQLSVRTVVQNDGSMNVYASSGVALVVGSKSLPLSSQPSPADPLQRQIGAALPGGGLSQLNLSTLGGSLGALSSALETGLPDAQAKVGVFAASLNTALNAIQALGVDANGNNPLPITELTASARQAAPLSGNGALAVTVDGSSLTTTRWTVAWNGAGFDATSASGTSGAVSGTGTATDPWTLEGWSWTMTGTPAAGDGYVLDPASLSTGWSALPRSPNELAVAGRVSINGVAANTGGTPQIVTTDPSNPAIDASASITFPTATTYQINGGPAQPFTGTIIGAGWEAHWPGTPPAVGDTWNVQRTPPGSSDNTNAVAWQRLNQSPITSSGTSASEWLQQNVVKAGIQAQSWEQRANSQQQIHSELEAQRASISGVSLDEEAAKVLQFQQSYQAAAQIIAVADTLFQSLLAAARR